MYAAKFKTTYTKLEIVTHSLTLFYMKRHFPMPNPSNLKST